MNQYNVCTSMLFLVQVLLIVCFSIDTAYFVKKKNQFHSLLSRQFITIEFTVENVSIGAARSEQNMRPRLNCS